MITFCRYGMKKVYRLFPLLLFVACAPSLQERAPQREMPVEIPQQASPVVEDALPEDAEQMQADAEGEELQAVIASMGEDPEAERFQSGRGALQDFLARHPESRWRLLCVTLLRLIDERQEFLRGLQAYRQDIEGLKQDKEKVLHESDYLKRDLRQLQERLQEETIKAQKEKEQLKRDLNLLKDLEIQRERREKSLR